MQIFNLTETYSLLPVYQIRGFEPFNPGSPCSIRQGVKTKSGGIISSRTRGVLTSFPGALPSYRLFRETYI